MIGIVAFVALAVSTVLGQECSFDRLSQNFADIASPVSPLSGNFLSSGIRSAPSVRSQIVSAPVFLNDGPALMTQATCRTSGPLVATPAVSQSLSPAGSISSALSTALSSSGPSSFNSAVGSSDVISVASAVPAYVSSRIPSNQVASSSSISLPSFRTVSSPFIRSVAVPSSCLGSAASAPSVISSGLFQSPVSQVVSSAPSVQSVQSSFVPSFQSSFVPSAQSVRVECPAFNTVSSPVVSDVFESGISGSFGSNRISC